MRVLSKPGTRFAWETPRAKPPAQEEFLLERHEKKQATLLQKCYQDFLHHQETRLTARSCHVVCVHLHRCTCTSIHTYIYIYMYIYVCTHTHICTFTHTCAHMHTHTLTRVCAYIFLLRNFEMYTIVTTFGILCICCWSFGTE